jgi:uncharacterized protein
MSDERLLPELDDDSRPFWEGAARGELLVQGCADCGRLRVPPRPMCPACRSMEAEWRPVSGRGRIWSFAVVHPPVLPAYAALTPYPVVVVELDEDPTLRMVANVVPEPGAPINAVDPDSLHIGAPLHVTFEHVDEEIALPRWVIEGLRA